MSILNAMYAGVSGLDAEGEALGVIGNNVSNSNTVGFKESRAVFENVMGSAIGSPNAIGAGVRMDRAQQVFTQGSMLNTGQPTDLAISGDGFFVVNGTAGGVTGNFYTRAPVRLRSTTRAPSSTPTGSRSRATKRRRAGSSPRSSARSSSRPPRSRRRRRRA